MFFPSISNEVQFYTVSYLWVSRHKNTEELVICSRDCLSMYEKTFPYHTRFQQKRSIFYLWMSLYDILFCTGHTLSELANVQIQDGDY